MIILGYLNIIRMHSPDRAWPRVSPLLTMPPTAHYSLQTPHWHWGTQWPKVTCRGGWASPPCSPPPPPATSPGSGPVTWSAPVPPSHTVTMAVTANGQPTLTTPAVACLKIIITDPGVLRNGWWFDAVLTRASNEGSWKFTITPFKCLLMVESAFKHFHIYLRICYATLMCSLRVTLIASILNTFMFRLNVNC